MDRTNSLELMLHDLERLSVASDDLSPDAQAATV
jgi:hypothetical protein